MANYLDKIAGIVFKEKAPYIKHLLQSNIEMLNDTYGYDGKFAINSSDLRFYIYDSTYTSPITGHYKKFNIQYGTELPVNVSENDFYFLTADYTSAGVLYEKGLWRYSTMWEKITGASTNIFTDVRELPTTGIQTNTIYRLEGGIGKFNKFYKFTDSEAGNYTISTTGITIIASTTTQNWDEVSENWETIWLPKMEETSYAKAKITQYKNNKDECVEIDRDSFFNGTYTLYYYKNGWVEFGKGGVESINGMTGDVVLYAENIELDSSHSKSILSALGNLSSLLTTAKDSIVNAINEIVNDYVKKDDIIDTLDSEDTDKALSAKMGKKLNDTKVSKTSTSDNLLFKFDKDNKTLDAVDEDGNSQPLALFDTIYPVGSIYMNIGATLPASFKGTWEKITDGTFLMSANGTTIIGATGGEAKHTLTTSEMPSHSHGCEANGNHSHYYEGYYRCASGSDKTCKSNDWISGDGAKYSSTAGNHSHTINNSGGGVAHNNLPPYLAVSMWKRTA